MSKLVVIRTTMSLAMAAVATLPGPFELNDYPPDY